MNYSSALREQRRPLHSIRNGHAHHADRPGSLFGSDGTAQEYAGLVEDGENARCTEGTFSF
jgi:hypothetical protein